MLSDHIRPGVQMIGLAELISSGRPAFDGLYRIMPVGTSLAVEFFDAAARPANARAGMSAVRILPYRTSKIAEVALGGQEAISGEFTGCLMTVFDRGGTSFAAHVDTNKDTTQRAAWNTMKAGLGNVSEYDTTGQIGAHPGGAENKVIICIGGQNGIEHYFVRKSEMKYGAPKMNHLGMANMDRAVVYTVLHSHGV